MTDIYIIIHVNLLYFLEDLIELHYKHQNSITKYLHLHQVTYFLGLWIKLGCFYSIFSLYQTKSRKKERKRKNELFLTIISYARL